MVERATTKMQQQSEKFTKLENEFKSHKKSTKSKLKELNNVYKQLDIAKKEIRSLQYRLETSSNEEVLNALSSKNKELKKENDELHREIKACEKIQTEQSKELMKITQESDYYNRIKSLNEELRMYKVRGKEYQEKYNNEKESNQELKDKLRDFENKHKDLKSKKK